MTDQSLSMLVHGYSKVGKSLLGASTPPPRLYLDVEAAARFLPMAAMDWDPVNPPPTLKEMQAKQVDTAVVAVDTWQTAVQALDWLKTDKHPFVSVVLDSVSELQNRNVIKVSGNSQMKIQDWGEVLREVGGYIRSLRDMTYTHRPLKAVLVTAMSRMTDAGILAPHLQGQLRDVIPYLLDVCGYLYVEADAQGVETRYLLTRRRNQKEAGERVGGRIVPVLKLPNVSGTTAQEVMEKNRTFELILKKVYATGGAKIAPPAKVEVPQPTTEQTPDGAAEEATP